MNGLILQDLPFQEKEDFVPVCTKYGISLISLAAPTSQKRIAMIAAAAEGFLYIVFSLGMTGTRREITTDLVTIVETVRQNTMIPSAIVFGISGSRQAKNAAEAVDGVTAGSAIIELLEQYGKNAPRYIDEYVKIMNDVIRRKG